MNEGKSEACKAKTFSLDVAPVICGGFEGVMVNIVE